MPSLTERFKNSWNAFFNNRDPSPVPYGAYTTFYKPDRIRLTPGNERTIINAIYTRIAMDVAAIGIEHVRVDDEDRYISTIDSYLNRCFTVSTNIDQTPRAFLQDAVMSMFDEGCVALIPTDTSVDPRTNSSYDIYSLRTGKIKEWRPFDVKVEVYNERLGKKEEVYLPKDMVAIIENPFYSIMNEPNSTLKRLIRKMTLLDIADENSSSGKLDLIIQLPYVIKTEARRQQAEIRRKDIEMQLAGSKYGIAYTDGTERITQLNRAVENSLPSQVDSLIARLYSQLGMTEEILNGTANEQVMLNYYNRTVEPIISAFCDEMKRKWLTKTAITQGQSIKFFRDPFKLVTINSIAEVGEVFTRNAVMAPNEVRGIIGLKPSQDPNADLLKNRNLYDKDMPATNEQGETVEDIDAEISKLDAMQQEVDNA